ncbi:MAG: hypothetical protein R2731_05945 [Nocardioides sp.]
MGTDPAETWLTALVDLESSMARERERREAARGNASRSLAARLEEAAGPRALLLHDRRRGADGAGDELSHVAITPTGVWVIEAWQYDGARVDVALSTGSHDTERERLLVGGRDKTLLVKSLVGQHHAVATALAPYDVHVGGLLCFVGALLPRVWRPSVQGFDVVDVPRASEVLRAPGPLGDAERQLLHDLLAAAFPRSDGVPQSGATPTCVRSQAGWAPIRCPPPLVGACYECM